MTFKAKPLWVDSCAWYPYSKGLHHKLILPSRFDDAVDVSTIRDDALAGKLIGVPREWCEFPWQDTHLDGRTDGVQIVFGKMLFPPKNKEQARVIQESRELLVIDRSHIVQASTGFGKTYVGANLIKAMGCKALVVVTKEDLMDAWPVELKKFLGLADSDIGIIQQDRCEVAGKKVVVAMVHSLAQREYPPEIRSEFGLVIFDEVHHMAAETFSRAAAMFNARLRVGFSATPERIDGKDFVFHGHIGQVRVQSQLVAMPPKVLVAYSGWKLPMVNWWIDGERKWVKLPHEAGKMMHVYKAMAEDAKRNALIVGMAVQAYNKGRWTVVLSDLAEDLHLGRLRELCAAAGVPDSDMAFYKGGMKKTAREAAKSKRLVFATFGMTGEATDVPWWDCVILATPRANVKQAVGRVVREYPNKPKPVVVDIVDTDSDILMGYFKARVKQYTSSELQSEVIYL